MRRQVWVIPVRRWVLARWWRQGFEPRDETPLFVMPGLDPGIHVERPHKRQACHNHVDGRIKSGHDS